jgi:hypothetical protein
VENGDAIFACATEMFLQKATNNVSSLLGEIFKLDMDLFHVGLKIFR